MVLGQEAPPFRNHPVSDEKGQLYISTRVIYSTRNERLRSRSSSGSFAQKMRWSTFFALRSAGERGGGVRQRRYRLFYLQKASKEALIKSHASIYIRRCS